MSEPKPVPGQETISATDEHRRRDANISPQGRMHPDEAPRGSEFTPEGDREQIPSIPPSANDPV